jgi:diguanylate cyclase (GGDEF)-like protein
MPSRGGTANPRLPIEDSYLELLADTLDGLDVSARGQFLQRYIRTITHLDLREDQCIQLWDEMLTRRRELSENLGRKIALSTALMDVLTSAGLFRVPIVLEYDELKMLQVNAVTDPLTGLYNRRLFGEAFDKELNRSRRYGSQLGLVILDLHRFKEVNDKYGHPRGDEVLRAAAATLKKALRTSDSAFRIGGDEFALLLPETDTDRVLALSRRVETVFAETLHSLQLSISVNMDHGVAVFPQDGEQADQLIRVADERLYRLKHATHRKSANDSSQPEAAAPAPATAAAATLSPAPAPAPVAAPAPASGEAPQAPQQKAAAPSVAAPSASAAPATAPAPAPTPVAQAAHATAERVAPAAKPPISIESRRTERQETVVSIPGSAAEISGGPTAVTPPAPRSYAMQRKAERVSMTGTNAYAMLGETNVRRARVVDLGFGGVAIEMDAQEELPENILAILHVPILPPVRVSLRPVWSQRTKQGAYRIGCAFVS